MYKIFFSLDLLLFRPSIEIESKSDRIAAESIRTENTFFYDAAENTSASTSHLMQQFLLNHRESMKFTKSRV
jgi:hypothetical protein